MFELYNVNIPLKIVNVILGIPHIKTQDDVLNILNYLILHGKWYIYWCKKNSNKVSITGFRKYLKKVFSVKYELLHRIGKISQQWIDILIYQD